MRDGANIVAQGRILISKSHPRRAVVECFAGFACYEASEWAPGQAQMHADRVGITPGWRGAQQWLRGATPDELYQVAEDI